MENFFIIENWLELKELYINSATFSSGQSFNLVFNLILLWRIIGKHSKFHENRLKEIENNAKHHYKKKMSDKTALFQGGLKVLQKIGSFANKFGKKQSKEKDDSSSKKTVMQSVFYFLKKITYVIEVVNSEENVITYFPIRPPCFMLSNELKLKYRAECDITDSNKKMTELMIKIPNFIMLMNSDLNNYRNWRFLFRVVSREWFHYYLILLWWFGLVMNIL